MAQGDQASGDLVRAVPTDVERSVAGAPDLAGLVGVRGKDAHVDPRVLGKRELARQGSGHGRGAVGPLAALGREPVHQLGVPPGQAQVDRGRPSVGLADGEVVDRGRTGQHEGAPPVGDGAAVPDGDQAARQRGLREVVDDGAADRACVLRPHRPAGGHQQEPSGGAERGTIGHGGRSVPLDGASVPLILSRHGGTPRALLRTGASSGSGSCALPPAPPAAVHLEDTGRRSQRFGVAARTVGAGGFTR